MKKTNVIISAFLLGLFLLPSSSLARGDEKNWSHYFTRNESKAIKKMVEKYVRNQIKRDSSKWDGLITKDQLKKNSVRSEHIKNGSIMPEDLNEDTLSGLESDGLKKIVYAGTIEQNLDVADFVVGYGGDEYSYWKKIEISEIKLDDMPQVIFYYKQDNPDGKFPGNNLWKVAHSLIDNEGVWIRYAFEEKSSGKVNFSYNEYKIVVIY